MTIHDPAMVNKEGRKEGRMFCFVFFAPLAGSVCVCVWLGSALGKKKNPPAPFVNSQCKYRTGRIVRLFLGSKLSE